MEDRARALFSFGIIADVQFADIDDGTNYRKTRRRFYRNSVALLRDAVRHWEETRVNCVIQLGDAIDGHNKSRDASEQALDTVMAEFEKSSVDVHHVWGNHEFYNFSRETLMASPLNSAGKAGAGSDRAESDLIADDIYAYEFSPAPRFRFVLLDAYDASVIGRDASSEKHQQAMKLLQKHNSNADLNTPPVCGLEQRFVKFNGGFSAEQLQWLDRVLTLADQRQERVTLFSHLPVHPDATDPICLAWNYDELLSILRAHKSVAIFISGHDHDGGFCTDASGVHHITLEGVIETHPDTNAFATVYVYEDQMLLKGNGRTADRVLKYP
ncbi:manganese-dependent ADP-ribose/CDP-alcohol diphosphatase [Pimephales promelas]|uniref:manganese-dependent ADP-ribose/CDP-alcohol diphosphatase n=1 Tax=Pimephales promelas TaxID=90988 RepID=UPI0019558A0B|nr:manganese-dependent ADP-ribose/CDP-alcohol diphosphatase [Pimephales promelas]KAG1935660.1 manganese-dependent ADP-ribose/CDP-alcohol diphosphatase [Pimephales promelas]